MSSEKPGQKEQRCGCLAFLDFLFWSACDYLVLEPLRWVFTMYGQADRDQWKLIPRFANGPAHEIGERLIRGKFE